MLRKAGDVVTTCLRPSACLIVVNSANEVLLIQRSSKSSQWADATVFPGGNFDAQEDESLTFTAIRETFEETGMLLASPYPNEHIPADISQNDLDAARRDICSGKRSFSGFLAQHRLAAEVDALLPFSQWVTPTEYIKRFKLHFYVAFVDAMPSTCIARKYDVLHRIKDNEIGDTLLIHPLAAIERYVSQDPPFTLLVPHLYQIRALALVLTTSANTSEQRTRVKKLSDGQYGKMTLNPFTLEGNCREGRTVFTYEGDETRGGPLGNLHRTIVNIENNGLVTLSDEMVRTFDIFDGIDPGWWKPEVASAKL